MNDGPSNFIPVRRPPRIASRSPEQWRDYYDEQGRDATASGREIMCTTRPIINVVMRMVLDPRWDFNTVLDVGCGSLVPYFAHLESTGRVVTGVDFSASFIDTARAKGQVRSVQADATALPFPDGSFDAVLCSETLEHVPDDRGAVAEIHRVLRPGGLLFLTVPIYWNAARILAGLSLTAEYRELQIGHLREYSRRTVDRLLGQAFEVRARYPVPFLWRGPVGGTVDALIRWGPLACVSVSVALVAKKFPS